MPAVLRGVLLDLHHTRGLSECLCRAANDRREIQKRIRDVHRQHALRSQALEVELEGLS